MDFQKVIYENVEKNIHFTTDIEMYCNAERMDDIGTIMLVETGMQANQICQHG